MRGVPSKRGRGVVVIFQSLVNCLSIVHQSLYYCHGGENTQLLVFSLSYLFIKGFRGQVRKQQEDSSSTLTVICYHSEIHRDSPHELQNKLSVLYRISSIVSNDYNRKSIVKLIVKSIVYMNILQLSNSIGHIKVSSKFLYTLFLIIKTKKDICYNQYK